MTKNKLTYRPDNEGSKNLRKVGKHPQTTVCNKQEGSHIFIRSNNNLKFHKENISISVLEIHNKSSTVGILVLSSCYDVFSQTSIFTLA